MWSVCRELYPQSKHRLHKRLCGLASPFQGRHKDSRFLVGSAIPGNIRVVAVLWWVSEQMRYLCAKKRNYLTIPSLTSSYWFSVFPWSTFSNFSLKCHAPFQLTATENFDPLIFTHFKRMLTVLGENNLLLITISEFPLWIEKQSSIQSSLSLNWRSSYLLPVILTGICLTHRVYLLGHRNPEPARINPSNWCLFVPGLCAHNLLDDEKFNSTHRKIPCQPWTVAVGSIHDNHRHLEK